MTFLNTGILLTGLLAVAIPVIIHLLFRRRKKPLEWGAMRFVLEAYRKTRRRTTLERWLLLATRCLLLTALAVGLGRPLLERAGLIGQGGGRVVYVIVDDSIVAQSRSQGETDLKLSLDAAGALLDALGPGDRAGIILASSGKELVMPPSGDTAAVRRALASITPTDAPPDLPAAVAKVAEHIRAARAIEAPTEGKEFVLLASAFRAGSASLTSTLPKLPAGTRVFATPVADTPTSNVAVRAVAALRPVLVGGNDLAQTVSVSLRRFGPDADRAGETSIRVRPEGTPESSALPALVRWSPGQREANATIVLDNLPAAKHDDGSTVMLASIDPSPSNSIPADDLFRLPLLSRQSLRVGVIADALARGSVITAGTAEGFKPGQWVRLALRPSESSPVDVIEIDPAAVDAPRLADLDACVVVSPESLSADAWTRLRAFVDAGGLVLLTPAMDAATHHWADAMNTGLGITLPLPRTTKDYDIDDPGRLAPPAPVAGDADLLATLRGELAELIRPVAVLKILPPDLAARTSSRDDAAALLSTADGSALLTLITRRDHAVRVENTRPRDPGAIVYLACAVDLRWTDLPAKPLMVPMLQELIRQGVGRARPAVTTTAGAKIAAPGGTATLRARGGSGHTDANLTLDGTGRTADAILHAGVFEARDARGTSRGLIAVNPAADATDTASTPSSSILQWLEAAADAPTNAGILSAADLSGGGGGVKLSHVLVREKQARATGPMLLALAAALALIEVALARAVSRPTSAKGVHA